MARQGSLNLLQHGLIRSDRAFLNNDLSQLLSQFFDGVVVVVPTSMGFARGTCSWSCTSGSH